MKGGGTVGSGDARGVPDKLRRRLEAIYDRLAQSVTGDQIPIEERDPEEVRRVFGTEVTPSEADAANFAFDVTPNDLITAIITDVGVLRAPYDESIRRALNEEA